MDDPPAYDRISLRSTPKYIRLPVDVDDNFSHMTFIAAT
jgi:hypothetical protein